MKRMTVIVAILLGTAWGHAQEISVEKSLFGVQTGFLGLWVHNEARLTPNMTLRSEVGLDAGFGGGYNQFYQTIGITKGYALVPSITLEPRYFYNLKQRNEKGKNISKNSGNFFALRLKYFPDWFVIANHEDEVSTTEQISFIPKWGMKRTIGNHFTYEVGIGAGYFSNLKFDIKDQHSGLQDFPGTKAKFDKDGFMVDLHLRIGYTF